MIGLALSAIDTLHFRDSSPYAPSRTSPEHPSGHFPPHPPTVVGAVRAWLARGQGWTRGRWPPPLTEVLGDGYSAGDLGRLNFDGPYLLRHGEPLFALPAHLLGEGEGGGWEPRVALRPGQPVEWCDLGRGVRLPGPVRAGLAPGTDRWLTRAGMATVLRGGVPASSEVVCSEMLWRDEPRIGIKRDRRTRTVQEGMLYTSRHARPAEDVAVGVRVGGVPDGWFDRCAGAVPMGGEGRVAEYRRWDGDTGLETPLAAVLDRREAMVVALTPIDAGDEFYHPGGRIAGLGDATVVSACLPRVERLGGWGTNCGRPGPLPLRSILSAGSTFFCAIGDPDKLRAAVEGTDGHPRVGEWQAWGFGAVAIGVWPDAVEETG